MSLVSIDGTALKAALARARDGILGGAKRITEATAKAGESLAKATTTFKDRSGELRRRIKAVPGRRGSWFVKAGAKHSVFLENGTGLYGPKRRKYPIRAKNVAFLVFRVNGRWVKAKKVMHPGIKPRKFMATMAAAMAPVFPAAMRDMVTAVAERFNK